MRSILAGFFGSVGRLEAVVMRLLLSAVAAALVSAVPLRADIVFTGFQSSSSSGCTVHSASGFGTTAACAAAFTPTADYSMTDAQVKVETLAEQINGNFDLFLYSDNGGLPGSSLGMIGTGNAPATYGIVTVASPALSLTSGTEYWLVVAPDDANTFMNWASGGNPGSAAGVGVGWPSASWGLNGTPTSSQFQIDGIQVSSIPEPATFGLVGATILLVTLREVAAALKGN
jgi:hypothetical protein